MARIYLGLLAILTLAVPAWFDAPPPAQVSAVFIIPPPTAPVALVWVSSWRQSAQRATTSLEIPADQASVLLARLGVTIPCKGIL